jgi:hypothetical protein
VDVEPGFLELRVRRPSTLLPELPGLGFEVLDVSRQKRLPLDIGGCADSGVTLLFLELGRPEVADAASGPHRNLLVHRDGWLRSGIPPLQGWEEVKEAESLRPHQVRFDSNRHSPTSVHSSISGP